MNYAWSSQYVPSIPLFSFESTLVVSQQLEQPKNLKVLQPYPKMQNRAPGQDMCRLVKAATIVTQSFPEVVHECKKYLLGHCSWPVKIAEL